MTQEEWVDCDKLNCLKCDRFVSYLNDNGLCSECEGSQEPKEKEND